MSNINNKHIPEDLDSLTRKDMVELFKIQLEEHQGFIKEIESLREQLAKANERVKELELHGNSIADALGFNAKNNNRFATSVICTNISNLTDFSNCLSRIEDEFLMVESEPDELGEVSQEVAFSKWGLTPIEYCSEFGKWLNKFAIEKKIEALESFANYAKGDDWEDAYLQEAIKIEIEQLRKEKEL